MFIPMILYITIFSSSLQQLKLAPRKICRKTVFFLPVCIIFHSALKRDNSGQKKPVFWQNLRGKWETLVLCVCQPLLSIFN